MKEKQAMQNESKNSQAHTPGPWTKVFLNGNWHIARTDGRVEIAKVSSYKARQVSTGNARLMTASPDLLAACKALCAMYREVAPYGQSPVVEQALLAIKKAEGQ